uniref:DUF551 domain-containing protein n=1 Tax=Macrostomum lignano TaxID=282301 RepID=A0A1I8ICH2_9PLAT
MPVRCQSDASQMPVACQSPPLTIAELSHQPAPKQEAYRFDPDAGIKTFQQLPKVTEAMARDILLQAAAEQCCRGRDFIKDLPITKVEKHLGLALRLGVLPGGRYTCWTYKPFTGQEEVDSRDSGHVPGPWDVELKPSDMFEDEDREGIVPHTDTV